MRSQQIAVLLSAVNLAILGLILLRASGTPAFAETGSQPQVAVLRGRALELVDQNDQVRASIMDANGNVLLRPRDRNGAIRVKLGAGESGSGLLLVDEASQPAVHLIARRNGTLERPLTSRLTLKSAQGSERVIQP